MNIENPADFADHPEIPQTSASELSTRIMERPATSQVNLENVRDFKNVCRTCATITESVITIFAGEGLRYKLADKINQHLPIKVSSKDKLPLVVCQQCASTLQAWHEMVKCTKQADLALKAKLAADKKKAKLPGPETRVTKSEFYQSMYHKEDPFTLRYCQFCDTVHSADELDRHIVVTHSEDISFCEDCSTYVSRKTLVEHMRWHTDELTREQKFLKDLEELLKLEAAARLRSSKPLRTKKSNEDDVDQSQSETKSESNMKEDVNKNPITAEPTQKLENAKMSQSEPKNKNKQENEFFDHSDTENGFEAIPESVFKAIEDTQDASPSCSYKQPENENSSTEEKRTTKSHKKTRTCPICSKVYKASSSFFYHMKYTHKRIKEHECSVCGKKFATRGSLTAHTTTHTGESNFECKECNKCFTSKASLYIHEQTHKDIKTWKCSECQTAFRWKTHLMRHMKRHSEEKANVCNICDRKFSVRYDLLRHARTHDAGNFKCEKCDTKFSQIRYLKAHMKKKHSTTKDLKKT